MAIIQLIKLKETNWGDEANSMNTNFEQLNSNKAEKGQEITPEVTSLPGASTLSYTYENSYGIEETYEFKVGQTVIFQDDRGKSLYAFRGMEGDNAIWERVNDNGDAETTKRLYKSINFKLSGEITGQVTTDFKGNVDLKTTLQPIDASKVISGVFDIDRIPKGAIERMVVVPNKAARFKLTPEDVQNGDTVKETDTKLMYYVVDNTKLSTEAGYEVYQAGRAASCPWTGIEGKPTTFPPSSHTHPKSQITDFPTTWAWGSISGKPSVYPTNWENVADKPTTIEGYGITDAFTESDANGKYLSKNFPRATGSYIQVGEKSRDTFDTVEYYNNDIYENGNEVYGGLSISRDRYVEPTGSSSGTQVKESGRVLFMYTKDDAQDKIPITRLVNYYANAWAALDIYGDFPNSVELYFVKRSSTFNIKEKWRLWHQGNDGSGSGLDADTVDGKHASSFVWYKHDVIPNDYPIGVLGFAPKGSAGSIISGGPFLSFGKQEFSKAPELFQLQADSVNKKVFIRYIINDVIGPWTELATLDSDEYVLKALSAKNSDTVDNFHAIGNDTNNLIRRCTVYSETNGLSSYWVKFASVNIPEANGDRDLVLYVSNVYSNNSIATGILKAHVRIGNLGTAPMVTKLDWVVNNGIPVDTFKLYYDNNGNFELWCSLIYTGASGQYNSFQFAVISDGTRVNNQGTYWKLYNTKFSTVQTPTLPSSVNSTLLTIKNPTESGGGGGSGEPVNATWWDIAQITEKTVTLTAAQKAEIIRGYEENIGLYKVQVGLDEFYVSVSYQVVPNEQVGLIATMTLVQNGTLITTSSQCLVNLTNSQATMFGKGIGLETSGTGNRVLNNKGEYETTFVDATGWLDLEIEGAQVLTLNTSQINELKAIATKGKGLIKCKSNYFISPTSIVQDGQILLTTMVPTVNGEEGTFVSYISITIQINPAATSNNTTIWRNYTSFTQAGTGNEFLTDKGDYKLPKMIEVQDTRNDNYAPSSYARGIQFEFKTLPAVGLGSSGFCGIIDLIKWSDATFSGGKAAQLAWSGDGFTNLKIRYGNNSGWEAWKTIPIENTDASFTRVASSNGFYKESDLRIKSNVRELELSLNEILSIPTLSFEMFGKEQIGTIAQDIENICPQIVDEISLPLEDLPENESWEEVEFEGKKCGKVKVVEYEMFGVISLHGVKKLIKENQELKGEVNTLKSEMQRLQKQVEYLINKVGI